MLAAHTILAGKYVIVKPLESGGMGDVYEAFQKDLSRAVAIKLLRADMVGDPAIFLRFRREAEAAASLGHPNIVQILDFRNEPGEQPMLVMEMLEGRSLRDLLAASGTLAPPRAVLIALQILSALAAAHDASIVHRDVKPANVFILSTLAVRDFVKVLDFGIAKDLDPEAGALTDLGQVLGTAGYMAPEQAKGLAVDGRADLFAVGGILFQAISGKRPRTLGPAGILDAGTMPCARLHDVAPFVDPKLAAVVDRALALNREERFPSAKAMAKALAPFAPGDAFDLDRTAQTVQEGAGAPRIGDDAATVTGPSFANASTQYAPAVVMSSGQVSGPLVPSLLPAAPVAPVAPVAPTQLSRGSLRPPPAAPSASMYPRASLPVSSRWSGWFYALPAVGVFVVLAVFTGAYLYYESRAEEHERALLAVRPPRCVAPTTCSGRTTTSATDGEYAFCSPGAANRYRAGDVVLVVRTSRSRAMTVLDPGARGGVEVRSPTGLVSVIDPRTIRGAYCVP